MKIVSGNSPAYNDVDQIPYANEQIHQLAWIKIFRKIFNTFAYFKARFEGNCSLGTDGAYTVTLGGVGNKVYFKGDLVNHTAGMVCFSTSVMNDVNASGEYYYHYYYPSITGTKTLNLSIPAIREDAQFYVHVIGGGGTLSVIINSGWSAIVASGTTGLFIYNTGAWRYVAM